MDDHRVQALKLCSHVTYVYGICDSLTIEWDVTEEQQA